MTEDVIASIRALREAAMAELAGCASAEALEQYRIKFLGTKGQLKEAMKLLGKADASERPRLGQEINAVKEAVQGAFDARKLEIDRELSDARDAIDVTEPGVRPTIGRPHLVLRVADELAELFGRLGFRVEDGPELEDEWHNFIALNIPESHPARDHKDNFYLVGHEESPRPDTAAQVTAANPKQRNRALLRTQTSTVQIRVMESRKPPIRVVIPGRVYRPDETDATHLPMFHQLEALVVDRNVTMVDLKSTILQFVHAYFGHDTNIRFRPSFFPFTEPSAEVDVYFPDQDRWIELGGCGMVHPNVLTNCGIDPEIYTGWAFGFGIERIAMRKYGISDIRAFVENDLRFLRQF
jgi:phenylalanyl-tRNA synthetase alpha chain